MVMLGSEVDNATVPECGCESKEQQALIREVYDVDCDTADVLAGNSIRYEHKIGHPALSVARWEFLEHVVCTFKSLVQ